MNKKDFLIYTIILALLVTICYLGINKIAHFDAPALCYISVSKHLLRGEKKTVLEAIRLIKRESNGDYRTVCKYVDRVSENYCIAADWHLDPDWMKNAQHKSCYIQGSKTIYLFPEKENSAEVVRQRAQQITKLSRLSKEFWLRR